MCVFETIVKDSYTWIPFEQVEKVVFLEPKSLRDLYWVQVEMEMVNGTKGEMFLPSLYVNSQKSTDDQIRLGRLTDWKDVGNEIFVGEGTKLFAVGGEYISLPDIKEIEFLHVDEE
jgi:type VI secretion system protein ImpE